MTETWEHDYQSLDISPVSLGPIHCGQIELKQPTFEGQIITCLAPKGYTRQLVKAAATVRN